MFRENSDLSSVLKTFFSYPYALHFTDINVRFMSCLKQSRAKAARPRA